MGVRIQKIKLSKVATHKYARFDEKFYNIYNKDFHNSIRLKDIFFIKNGLSLTEFYADERTSKPFIRISDLSYSECMNTENLVYLSEDYNIREDLITEEDDIIFATIGNTIGKCNLVKNLKGGTFSNNTVCLKVKDKNKFSPKFLESLLHTNYMQEKIWGAISQKSQPNLQDYDLRNIPFPNISFDNQQQILATIAPLESEIASLKATKIPETDIINKVLGKELGLDWEKLKKIDQIKKVKINFSDLPTYNDTLRFSCRWNRAVEIQKELQNQFNQCEILGNHILKTQNGCSPTCGEEGDFQILGIDSISKSTVLSFENPKFTNDKITNFDKYVIHNNDFFVSRGNTIELVSLASIAEITDECRETIFPDLMIRITFDDKVDINYLAYIFNSLVGRLYFRNVTKGKNQTMVKVSEPELKKFIIPMPPKEKQSKIATLIKEQIDAQKIIDEQILKKQQQILQIIENAIR